MYLQFLIIVLLFRFADLTALHNERRQTIERVRNYLQEFDKIAQNRTSDSHLPNSNKIGFGYNLLEGSPICFTGACQMTEFKVPLFKLNYTSSVPGACTNKLVPNNVDLDCMPATSLKVESEVIDTVEHLHTAISNKVKVSVGAAYKGVAFSYSHARETKRILDNIVKHHRTSIHTAAEISCFRLSLYEPFMELSDNFRHTIENMPCCEEDDLDIEEYVKEFIFNHFGFTYISSMLLGGVAQQTIFIDREAKERLESNQISITHEAQISFGIATQHGAQAGTSVTNSQTNSNHETFMKEVQSLHTNSKGGATHLTTLVDWSRTVIDNPVITHFELRDIFRLLTSRYFANDSLIANKSQLIEKILKQHLSGSMYCYDNCGGNGTRGTCVPTGYFNFGICQCKPGWTGVDCETKELPKILHGTLCGFDRSFMRVNCHGQRPWQGCPKGWAQKNWETDLTVCYKDQSENGIPVHGTLCGLYSYHGSPYSFSHTLACDSTANVNTDACPEGYQKNSYSSAVPSRRNTVCTLVDATENLPGTLCGMQIEDSINGPTCDGFNPGLRQCPSGYTPGLTAFNHYGFLTCMKN